jgi:sterol desaturase/sphingolipid hydroxylase (fatty acid hydroxylase superfamily)
VIKWLEEYLDFFLYPQLLALLLYLDRDAFGLSWVGLFVLGWVAWTFAEYWIHRSVLHWFYWDSVHMRHHDHPRELSRFPLWQVPSYFLAIYGVVWGLSHLAGSNPTPVFAGIVLGWVMFFVMHHVMHHAPSLLPNFSIRHNAHHKLTHMNYGITVDWWDRVFGTYRQPRVKA